MGPLGWEKGEWDEVGPWKRSRGAVTRELDLQDHKERKGVSAQTLLNPLNHHCQEASWGWAVTSRFSVTYHMGHRPPWLKSHSRHPGLHCPAKAFTDRCLECSAGVMPTHVWDFAEEPHPMNLSNGSERSSTSQTKGGIFDTRRGGGSIEVRPPATCIGLELDNGKIYPV